MIAIGQKTPDFRAIAYDCAPDAIYMVDAERRVVFWSAGAEAAFEVGADEVLGRDYVDLIVPPDRRDAERRFFAEALLRDAGTHDDLRRRSDGTLLYVTASHRALTAPDGSGPYVLFSEKDISELRTLREGQWLRERFAPLVESVPDGIVAINVIGRIVMVNSEASRMFGYETGELEGKPVEMLLPKRLRTRHVGLRASYFESPRGRPMGEDLDLSGLRRNGEEFPIEISLSPLSTDGGVIAVSAIRDVSRRRAADREFRALLESAPDAMVIVDRSGTIVLVNGQAERVFGYDRAELLGQSIEMLVPQRLRHRHARSRDGFFAAPRTRAMGVGLDLMGRRKDGSEFPVEISLSPLETESGTLVSSAIRDISARLAVERELRAKDIELEKAAAKDRFLASMSHELRTPLNAIIGFAGILQMGVAGPLTAAQRDHVSSIETGGRHLLALIGQLLDLAKIESGAVAPDMSEADLCELIRSAVEMLRPAAGAKGIAIEAVLPAGARTVRTDPRMIMQILINLVGNAVKFTDAGNVSVTLAATGDEGTKIEVRDTGVGIAKRDLAEIFDLFHRGRGAADREGTGIGLYVSRQLAQLLGARIEVESIPGKGSTFTLVLPAAGGG